MKIFRTIQGQYAILGIIRPSSQSNHQKYSFNKRIFFEFFMFVWCIGLQLVYLFYEANGFMEYMECICSASAGAIVLICFMAILFRKSLLFKSIDNLEEFIDSSEPPKFEFDICDKTDAS